MEAYADGKDQLTSTLLAAKTFYKSYTSSNPPNPSSPCVKANLAFAAKSPLSKSNSAMAAFIDKAVEDGNAVADPVCAAATLAFLDAKIAKSSDKEASSAASDLPSRGARADDYARRLGAIPPGIRLVVLGLCLGRGQVR